MSTLNQSNNRLKAKVMESPAYRERCSLLFDLFRLSREAPDPKTVLEIQAGLSELLMHLQRKKAEFRKEGNQVGLAVVKRLTLILKRIADSIVWRALGYDRVAVQLLAEHSATGHLDDTVFGDLTLAWQIVEQEGAIVLVNDLTTILRHGDLTIIKEDDNSIALEETKYGKASRRDRSAIRQRRRLEQLVQFLNTGTRVTKNRRDFILKVDVPIRAHHSAVAEAISQARKNGYHGVTVSDCLAIEALWMEDQRARFPQERPFRDVEHIARFNNLQAFDKPTTRIAPYGIFPFDHKSCFDLITGDIFLVATLNFDRIQARYNQFGLTLELPQLSKQQIETYSSASIAEKKELMYHYNKCVIGGGNNHISTTLIEHFAQISFEFIHEDTIVQADRQQINLISDLEITDGTRFYVGYRDESGIWA
jgi:hypothetical protein